MNKINFIYLRSLVGDNKEFKNQERNNFLNELNKNNEFEFVETGKTIFFIETGGTEEIFKSIYKEYKEPYILLATDANNSLPASLEIATFLRNNNLKYELIHGTPNEARSHLFSLKESKILRNCRVFSTNSILFNKKYGVIGRPSDWLISSNVNYCEVSKKIGASIIDIDINELLNLYKNKSYKIDTSRFTKFLNKKVNEEVLEGALKIYHAIKELILKYELDGITIRCFDLLSSVKNTSCLALAMLNSEGIIATCEGDVPAMLTMAIIKEKFNQSSFQVNPSYINIKERYAYFAHCTLPFDMCEEYSFDSHFESGLGIGIRGKLKIYPITIFKINSNLLNYEVFEGNIVENLEKINLCRTQIKVNFDEDIDEMLTTPNGNHLIVFYGRHAKELVEILSH